MNWARPDWLMALPVVALLAVVLVWATRRHRRSLREIFEGEIYDQVLPVAVRRRRVLRDLLGLTGLALVVVALAEPRFDKELQTIEARGTDIALVVDLSRSMDARDVEPSRIERVRREIADLVKVLEGDRVGLVVFAGGAYARMPLTTDYGALLSITDELRSDTFTVQGSAFGEGIDVAVDLLQRSREQAGQAILLLSDGEAHEGNDARAAADRAAEAGIAIYTMGVGEGPSRIPDPSGWLTYQGEVVETTPDFDLLRDLARSTGGAFVKSVAAPTDIQGLYRDEMRKRLRAVQRAADQREVWRSAFQWPLGLGLMCLLASAWLGDGRRPWGQAAALPALLLVGGLLLPGRAVAGPLAEADQLYRSGRYAEAADRLTDLTLQRPTDGNLYDRLGAARYRAGDYEGAARAWDQADRLRGGSDAESLYNSGNAHYQAGRLEEALRRYDRALEVAPDHDRALQNRQLLVQELQRRQEEPPPPPPGEGEGEDDSDPSEGDDEQEQDPSGGDGQASEGDGDDDADQAADAQQQPSGSGGEGEPEDEGEGQASLDDLDPSDDDAEPDPSGSDGSGGYEEAGPITSGEAHRLLDGLEEGNHRVRISGRGGGKPW